MKTKINQNNSLLKIFPEIAKEWHTIKNNKLTPNDVTKGSNKKVWWICPNAHEYEAIVASRVRGDNCPYCSGRKVCTDNCLATVFPNIAKEWHPTKNNKLTPSNITPGSGKRIWWLCPQKHEYQAVVHERTYRKRKCPYCSGRKVCTDNCLATLFPNIAKEWHPTKNGKLTPYDITRGSGKKAWWSCPKGHSYTASIDHRTLKNTGCPFCTNQTSRPEIRILTELMSVIPNIQSRNKIHGHEIDIFIPQISLGIEYDGFYYHKNKQLQKDKLKNFALEKENIKLIRFREKPLEKISFDDIIIEKLSKKDIDNLLLLIINKFDQPIVTKIINYISQKKFQNDSKFREYLSYYPSPLPNDSLRIKNPNLAEEWDLNKNFPLTPENFTVGSSIKVYWNCLNGHTYKTSIKHRVNGTSCPYCIGQKASEDNCLTTLFPNIAKEWHPTKNGSLMPNDVTKGSNKNIWWTCPNGHTYQQSIKSRTTKGRACPYCSGQKVHKDTCLSALYPNIAKEWHPTKNDKLTPETIAKSSHIKAWWICPKGHEYQSACSSRTSGRNCPYCSGRSTCKENCLATLFPDISNEWHPSKNNGLTPNDVTPGSNKKAWWICPSEHCYQAVIYSRTKNNTGCLECYKLKKHR